MTKYPSARQLECLAATLLYGPKAGEELGIAQQTVKNTLRKLYGDLEVNTMAKAALAVGWLEVPQRYRKKEKGSRRKAD